MPCLQHLGALNIHFLTQTDKLDIQANIQTPADKARRRGSNMSNWKLTHLIALQGTQVVA